MKPTKNYILISIPIVLFLMACNLGQTLVTVREQITKIVRGSGTIVEESRQVEDFSNIDLSGIGEVVIEYGQREALSIEAEDNLIDFIETSVRGSTLVIGIEEDVNILPTESIRIFVTAVRVDSITISGAGTIKAPSIASDSIELAIEGLGSADIGELEADRLIVNIEGAGDITIDRGEVSDQRVTIEGLGNYDGSDLLSQNAEVEINGGGNATVWAVDSLDVSISGLGNVSYYGDPDVSLNRAGLGNITPLGDK